MKSKLTLSVIACMILCACSAEKNEPFADIEEDTVPETSLTEQTPIETNEIFESSSSETSLQTAKTNPVTVTAVTDPAEAKTETAASIITETQMSSEALAVTEASEPVMKDIVPVLTADNVDSETNALSWTAVEGAKSYILYLLNNETGEFEEYGEVKGTSCMDKKLIPNTKYTYCIAARYDDGTLGKMSDAKEIFTYSLCASAEQGDWIYSCEYNDDLNAKIIRTKSDGSITEDVTDYSFESANYICVSGKYIFFVEDLGYYSGRLIKYNMENHRAEVLKEYISDDGFGCYEIRKMTVYNNTVFYVTYGFWSETDSCYYDLCSVDFDGKWADVNANYDAKYSPIDFLNNENDLYIIWRDETIEEHETDDEYYLYGVYTDKCYVYDSAAQQTITVNVPEETSDKPYHYIKYEDGFLYIEFADNEVTKSIKANSNGFEYLPFF